jgi:hypothetical protein
MNRTAFIYYTHYVSDAVMREIRRLSAELPATYDLWVTGCAESPDIFKSLMIPRVLTRAYCRNDLLALPYPAKLADLRPERTTGSNDLALMRFFRDHPDYAHYWICEYDVRYSGSWTALVEELDRASADLLCTHLTRHKNDLAWAHWTTLKSPQGELTNDAKLRGFMPFCRVSQRLFGTIDQYCSKQWRGHYEALWPTVASLEGFVVGEIGGDSPFTPQSRSKRLYHSSYINKDLFLSTFGAWPNYSDTSNFGAHIKDTLWHPVKEFCSLPDVSASKTKDRRSEPPSGQSNLDQQRSLPC